MTSGLIALLLKDGNWEYLANWQPITLLNSSYKIFAKALQIRLQGLFLNIIHKDQYYPHFSSYALFLTTFWFNVRPSQD
jgi:hypothetical protein